MEEYIKQEDAMKALDEYRLSHTMSMHGDMELLMEFRGAVEGAMNAIAFVPTADVVPKSEYDAAIIDRNAARLGMIAEHERLKTAKTEVAREIFAEIEKAISSMKYNANTTRKTVKVEELKEQVDWVLHEVVPQRIAELKKKYIPKDCRDCGHFVGCEQAVWTGLCDDYDVSNNKNVDKCVVCGEDVPEGTQVCGKCMKLGD